MNVPAGLAPILIVVLLVAVVIVLFTGLLTMAIGGRFTPEFRNRLDGIIWFNHLDSEIILQVVDKFIIELQAQLDVKGVSLEVSSEARAYLAEKGYDKSMGARPMSRLIKEELKKELANELLFGELTKGGNVKVDLDNDKLRFDYSGVDAVKEEAEPS